MTASSRGPNSRCSAVKLAVRASRAAATASSGVAVSGAAAAPSASSLAWVSCPANSTSRLSEKCRKKVVLVSPARLAISATVVLRAAGVSGYVGDGANRWAVGPFGMVMTLGLPPMSNAATRRLLDWAPGHPGLIADLDEGHYFAGE